MPAEFTESKSAVYQPTNILGRSEPIFSYSHSDPRVFNLTLTFVVHGDPVNGPRPYEELIKPIRLIRSWVYPDYSGEQPAIPHRLLFVVGKWLSQRVFLQNYSIRYSAPWGYKDEYQEIIEVQEVFIEPTSTPAEMPLYTPTDTPTIEITRFQAADPPDSMIPYRADISMTLVEVTENTPNSPYDTGQVRRGEDRGSGRF